MDKDVEKTSDVQKMLEIQEPELNLRSGLALAGAALSYFITVGFLNGFGVFQEYYASDILRDKSNFQISWLGSFAIFSVFFFAPLAGILTDKYGCQLPMAIGSVCMLVAIFMISLCKEYYQFFLAQGLLLGFGMSFIAIPASSICPKYFERNRGLATGISVAGSSIGGVVWPIAENALLHNAGLSFAWTIRIVGFIMLPLHVLVVTTVRTPKEMHRKTEDGIPESDRPLPKKAKIDRSGLKSPPFILLCTGLLVANLGFFAPFFYLSTYAVHLGMSQQFAFYLVSVLNGASTFGRILPGFVADRLGRFNILTVSALLGGIVAFTWTTATETAGVVVWTAAYGFASGAILSLQIACATTLVEKRAAGAAVGVAFGSTSLAGLFSGPIAGELVKYGYTAVSAFTGSMLLAGAGFVMTARLWQSRNLLAKI